MNDYCFVIQPFDNGKYDKRYYDIFKPAIEDAGLKAYRVDEDDSVTIPINAIEERIRSSTICLADITEDNPNVWYEVGYAFASNKITILLCSEERSNNYPFDIRQRSVTKYKNESQSDFNSLRITLTNKIKKLKNSQLLNQVNQVNDIVDSINGLSKEEVAFIAAILVTQDIPDESVSSEGVKEQMKNNGYNEVVFNICFRKLLDKRIIKVSKEADYNGNEYNGIRISENGNRWILTNSDKFTYQHQPEDVEEIIIS